jgi:hypothetical protein
VPLLHGLEIAKERLFAGKPGIASQVPVKTNGLALSFDGEIDYFLSVSVFQG